MTSSIEGCDSEVVSKLLGHSRTTITERAYAQILAPAIRKELFEAFENLERLGERRPPLS